MNLQQSLVPSQSLPASSQHPLRSPYQTPKGVPPKAKPLCNTEPVPKRRRFEVVDGELSTEEQPQLKRKKCTPLPASTPQPVDRQDQVVTDIQTDQACSCSLNSSQEHPVDEDDASTHCRPVGEGRDVATGTGQDTESGCVSKRPNNHVTATRPAKSADHDSRQNASTGSRAQLLAGNPQSTAWSVRSPLRAGTPSVKPNMASKEVQAEVHQGTAAGLNPGVATQDDVGNSAAVAVTQQLNVTATQEFALFGLIYHFAATKGTPWLFM